MRKILILTLTMVFSFTLNVFADSEWDQTDVKPDKKWTIEFNTEMDSKTINEENIFIEDSNGDTLDNISVYLDSNLKKVMVINSSDYEAGEEYSLNITSNLKSVTGNLIDNPIKMDFTIKDEQPKINNKSELKQYLIENHSTLDTLIGTTTFTFDILESVTSLQQHDYWIQVEYDYDYFGGAMFSKEYTTEQKNILKDQLKKHQEKLARDIINLMPDKKLTGGYYDSWYKYPSLKVGLESRRYFSWTNYEYDVFANYQDTIPSTFRWHDLIDDELYIF